MASDPLRGGLDAGTTTTGLFVQLFEPAVIELAGRTGIDFGILDMEHTAATLETIEDMVVAARSVDLTTVIRLPGHDRDTLRRALDVGANGVLIPRIATVDNLEQLCEAAYFAPEGARGSCSLTRSAGFTLDADETYHERANEHTVVMGLVELETAVENVDALLDSGLLDAVLLGPGDLAQSMGHAGDLQHPSVVESLETVLNAAGEAGVPVAAYAVSEDNATEWVERGADCIVYSDVRLLRGAFEPITP